MKRIHAGFPTQVMIPPVVWVAASAVCRAGGAGSGCCGKELIPAVDGGGGGGCGHGGLLEPATSAAGGLCGRGGGGGFELSSVVLTPVAAASVAVAAAAAAVSVMAKS